MNYPYRRIPIESLTRKAVEDIKHKYLAFYELSFDPLTDIYYIVIGYMHDNNINTQLSVTNTVTRYYVKQRRHSTHFDSEIASMVDGMIRRLKQDFWDRFNISIAIDNETFIDFMSQLQDTIKITFYK